MSSIAKLPGVSVELCLGGITPAPTILHSPIIIFFHTSEITNDPEPIIAVYMKPEGFIIAYKTISGDRWARS